MLLVWMATIFGSQRLCAQDVAVGGETGFNLFARGNSNLALPMGANVEWNINGSLSLVGRLSYDIGLGIGNFNILYLNPEVRYHFSEVFEGAYVGGYLGFGPASFNGFYVSAGATGGYEFMLSDHFNLDINGQLGFGNVGRRGFNASGLHFRPTVALRYAF